MVRRTKPYTKAQQVGKKRKRNKYGPTQDVFNRRQRVKAAQSKTGIVVCVTCGRLGHYKRMHWGHYMTINNINTRFDERNGGIQCIDCNSFQGGRQDLMRDYIDKEWGQGTAERLDQLSKIRKSFDELQLSAMRKIWNKEIREIRKAKEL